MLLVGYFEAIGSQRGITWRYSDSLSLRQFLGIGLGREVAGSFLVVSDPCAFAAGSPRGRVCQASQGNPW